MSDTNCPYCNADIEIVHDDGYGYEEDGTFEQTCHACDKTFAFTTSIHLYYETTKAPCLNGGEHDWYKVVQCPKPPNPIYRCRNCTEEETRYASAEPESGEGGT